jgi:predicted GNAT superfamily acetyltransferase
MSAISYRITEEMDDMLQAEQLQKVVWGMSPTEILGAATMRWMVHIGGLLIGAWDKNEMIAFCIASLGKRDSKWILWSDMTGVHPAYQGQNIGYTLKQHQKKWTVEQGYEEIRWTFDPMQRGNAYFNFRKLGITSAQYHPNFYGQMQDDINRGLPADRLEAVWSLNTPTLPKIDNHENVPLVVSCVDGNIHITPSEARKVGIEIPFHIRDLKKHSPLLAQEWQSAVRTTFINLFKLGYQIVDFHKAEARAWYILNKNS